jgi:hypothetical protein
LSSFCDTRPLCRLVRVYRKRHPGAGVVAGLQSTAGQIRAQRPVQRQSGTAWLGASSAVGLRDCRYSLEPMYYELVQTASTERLYSWSILADCVYPEVIDEAGSEPADGGAELRNEGWALPQSDDSSAEGLTTDCGYFLFMRAFVFDSVCHCAIIKTGNRMELRMAQAVLFSGSHWPTDLCTFCAAIRRALWSRLSPCMSQIQISGLIFGRGDREHGNAQVE